MKGNFGTWIIFIGIATIIIGGLWLQQSQDRRLYEYINNVANQQPLNDDGISGILKNYMWNNPDYVVDRLNEFILCDSGYKAIRKDTHVFVIAKGKKYELTIDGLKLQE